MRMEARVQAQIDLLMRRYPQLEACREQILAAYALLEECYLHDGKLLLAGNGGSASDSEHIAGELMKRFRTPRPVPAELAEKLAAGKASAEELKAAASEISDQFTYGSNMRGSAEYRHHLGRVLLRRCMEEIQKKEEQ